MSGSDQKSKDKPSVIDDLVARGKALVSDEQDSPKEQAKRAVTDTVEVAKGIAQEVVGSAKIAAGVALDKTDLVAEGLADEAAGGKRRERSGAAEGVKEAGETFAEKAHDTLTGIGGAVRRTFKPGDEKDK
jgi:hypothetical protein